MTQDDRMIRQGLSFIKMHGLGNDYIYIDRFAESASFDPAALARVLADRHRGIGGDGLILVEPSKKAVARMRMFNADGSESEMCGNGVRCVGHIVVSRGYAAVGNLTIETGRGILGLVVSPSDSMLSQVRVDMGKPLLEPADIPTRLKYQLTGIQHSEAHSLTSDELLDELLRGLVKNGVTVPGHETKKASASSKSPLHKRRRRQQTHWKIPALTSLILFALGLIIGMQSRNDSLSLKTNAHKVEMKNRYIHNCPSMAPSARRG